MKRKVYTTQRERMTYQIIGFMAFPLVNVPLGIILWMISPRVNSQLLTLVLALPWIVNGIVIALAFLLHAEFGVGYMAFIGVALAMVTALSVVFVAACFVTILSVPVMGDLAGLVFIVLMAVGILGLGGIAIYFAIYVFQRWRST